MELFGILLSIPGAFVLSLLYRSLLLQAAPRFPWIGRVFRPASYAVLALLALELIGLVTIGAPRSRALLGPLYEVLRGLIFFLATPALINLLMLRTGAPMKWYVVAPVCTALAFGLVMLQFFVSEKLYGVEGVERPYRSSYSPARPYASISWRSGGSANKSHKFV
jgi:hypothetical protein